MKGTAHDVSRGRRGRPLAIAALALGLSACASTELAQIETTAARALISDEDERHLGQQLRGELEKEPGFRYLQDPAINAEVQRVAAPVLEAAKKARPGVEWDLRVIDAPDKVNAFATPGGELYVYSGLLAAVNSESELAGVVAHEAGHVVGRHAARQIVNAYGLQALSSLILGQNPGLLAQIASTLATRGTLLAHSRSEEDEADAWGVRFAAQAGYDPGGLVRFLNLLAQKEGGRQPEVLTWLSDHPATPDRIARVERLIAEDNLRGGRVGEAEYAPIKQRLMASAPAPARF